MATSTPESHIEGFLDNVRKRLDGFKLPSGPFDPGGPWRQTFSIWQDEPRRSMGWLILEKQAVRDGAFELSVDWHLQQKIGDFQEVRATLQCSADPLATPRSWHMQSMILRPTGEAIDDLTMEDQATVSGGVVELANGRKLFADNPLKNWTCNWSILEAVQRLDREALQPMQFSMLDFLKTRKDDQTLSLMCWEEVNLPGLTGKLRGYQHIGYGFMPWEYWVDEQHRLIAARTSFYGLLAIEKEANS